MPAGTTLGRGVLPAFVLSCCRKRGSLVWEKSPWIRNSAWAGSRLAREAFAGHFVATLEAWATLR